MGGVAGGRVDEPLALTGGPGAIARRITGRTKAIVVVHYAGRPAEMDEVMAVADARGVAVVEDVSHAHDEYALAIKRVAVHAEGLRG